MWRFITLVIVSACVQSKSIKKVCYDHVGCFDTTPPFNNSEYLPKSSKQLDIKLKLYTPNALEEDDLDYTNVASIQNSHFDVTMPLKIIIHGYYSKAKGNWVTRMKDEILRKEDANVIDVDWSKGASTPLYGQAVANMRVMAAQVKMLLKLMADDLKFPLENVHIIGHSLGAHAAGIIGNELDSKIGRITALDAAELSFKGFSDVVRVDSSDAKFVDAIHTDAGPMTPLGVWGGLGLPEPFGHVDFYVNGGIKQPGCKLPLENIFGLLIKRGFADTFACNHVRSHKVFAESINSPCIFSTFPCDSYEKFQSGQCTSCGENGCGIMGYAAQSASGRGIQYLNTLSATPFCGYQYKIIAHLESTESLKNRKGELHVSFGGSNGQATSKGVIKASDAYMEGKSYQGMIIVDKQFQPIEAVIVRYQPNKDSTETPFIIKSIDAISMTTNKKQESLPGPYSASGKSGATIFMNGEQSDTLIG